MEKLALTIPGASGQSQKVIVPSGIPKELQGGADTAGKALIQTGYNYVFYIAMFLAVIYIIFSGIQIVKSGGDSNKLAAARTRMIYAIVGLIVVILAFVIIGAVLKTTGLNPKTILGK